MATSTNFVDIDLYDTTAPPVNNVFARNVNLSTLAVQSADCTFPRNGVWSADLTCVNYVPIDSNNTAQIQNNTVAAPDNITIAAGQVHTLLIHGFIWAGTVTSVDPRELGSVKIRMVGGATGAYILPCKPLSWGGGPTLQVVAQSLLAQHGEKLNLELTSPALLQQRLNSFSTFPNKTLAANLTRLAQSANCVWRVDQGDPTTGVGGSAYFVVDDFSETTSLPTNAQITSVEQSTAINYDCPLLDYLPAPGTTDPNSNIKVNEVGISVTPLDLHVHLYSQQMSDFLLPPSTVGQTSVVYAGTVTAQSPADNSVSVSFDQVNNQNIPPLTGIRIGVLPGSQVSVNPGTRCYVAFCGGDPSKAVVTGFDGLTTGIQTVTLGPVATAHPVALSTPVDTNFNDIAEAAQAALVTLGASPTPAQVASAVLTFMTTLAVPFLPTSGSILLSN